MLICRLSRRLFMVFPKDTGPEHDYVWARELERLDFFHAELIVRLMILGKPWRHLLDPIILSPGDFERFSAELDRDPQPSPALTKLLGSKAPWEN